MIGQKRLNEYKEEFQNFNNNKENLNKEKKICSSKKPLWISEVKNAIKLFPLSLNEFEFGKIEDIMNQDSNKEEINQEKHPFFTTIKKMIYSFGDMKEPNKLTLIKVSNFVNKYISLLLRIFRECEFKKVIDFFYKEEKNKLESIKKFKHKSFFSECVKENEIENCFLGNDLNEEKSNINIIQNAHENKQDINSDDEDSFQDLQIFEEDENKIKIEREIINIVEDNDIKNKDSDYLINKEINEINREIAFFQDKRTELMDQKTYEEYIKCRQINFLSRGKKFFLNFLENILPKEEKFPNELKESSNLELIAFVLNEEIKKIIINSIKGKNSNKKLYILTQPLLPEDIEFFIQKELSSLTNCIEKFHSDINMINEFRKKKINYKNQNKFIKVKNGKNGELLIVIKKLIFIKDPEESEFLSKYKQISEVQVINGILKLREQLIKVKNQKINERSGLRKDKNKEKEKEKKGIIIGVKEMIDFIGIDNYYEYFLSKDYLKEINLDEIKMNELNSYLSVLNKINKRKICSKFEEWLNLSPEKKNEIKNEYKAYKV